MTRTRFEAMKGCYEMAVSLLSYGFMSDAEKISNNHYMDDYILELGRPAVDRIGLEVALSIDTITKGVYTDGEGCEYNSTKYKNGSSWRIDI